MIVYCSFAIILSVLFSLFSEKYFNAIVSDEKFFSKEKLSIKRFCIILAVNLSVFISCVLLHRTEPFKALFMCVGFGILLCIAFKDIKQKKISGSFLLSLLAIGIIITVLDRQSPWYMHIFGLAMGYIPMLLMRAAGEFLKKQELIGSGDVWLSGILGLTLGLQNYLLCGIVTSAAALIAVRIIRRKKHYDKMHTYPFAPFFFIGYTVSILFGDLIVNAFISAIVCEI